MKKVLSILFCCCFVLMGVALLGCSKSEPDPTFSTPYETSSYVIEFQGAEFNQSKGELAIYVNVKNKLDETHSFNFATLTVAIESGGEFLYFSSSRASSYNFGSSYKQLAAGQSTILYMSTYLYSYDGSKAINENLNSTIFKLVYGGKEIAHFKAIMV